ncbi:dihydrolipoamide acetyltransferase family protein [Mucilaginibacter gynuensis]|uniref:Dihydrolipoamide acetyltransferase component of pyruvate dehydrogenase complex n=2 Tax=Mucilaginibacter gynuensis TaxID=1302236 RepID=A0ABP8FRK8_9SPHI
MGESVAEATIIKWVKSPGDFIEADDTVVEIATDKVDSEVPSPVSGKLVELLFQQDDVVQVGDTIAIIETEGADEPSNDYQQQPEQINNNYTNDTAYQAPVVETTQPVITQQFEPEVNIPGTELLTPPPVAAPQNFKDTARFYSPLVKSIAATEGIGLAELDSIPGNGADGRLTKDDLIAYINSGRRTQTVYEAPQQETAQPVTPVAEFNPPVTPPPAPVSIPLPTPAPAVSVSGGDEIIEMDRMRKLIADHMVMSVQTSPHVTSFVEADVTNLVQWRDRIKGKFEKRENEKITFTPIFIEAVVKAIKDFPMINISVNGNQIIKKRDINISMATALPSGNLIVPVIKKADGLNLVGITKAVNDLAARARANKLQPDDIKDGTFTITNVGSFGNVMGTPIINQPQVAILAVGTIKKKPAVIETPQGDTIGIRQMMFLSLSYDHRVVDGMLGGSFVRRVADYLENWDVNREL